MLVYIEGLVGKLFKILPLREADADTKAFNAYLDSLWMELMGAYSTFAVLQSSADYVSILNIVGFLATHPVSVPQCKREVFKAIRLLERARQLLGGGADD